MVKEMESVSTGEAGFKTSVLDVAPLGLELGDAPQEMMTTEISSAATNNNPVILRTLPPPER